MEDITKWDMKEYNKWIKKGRPVNIIVTELQLNQFIPGQPLLFDGIENLPNLTSIYCEFNRLRSLRGIQNLPNLKTIMCGYNELTSLNGLRNLPNLTELNCRSNKLTSLNGLKKLQLSMPEQSLSLISLNCDNNQITSLNGLNKCINLNLLTCDYNIITTLNGLKNLTNLIDLNCCNNEITSLNELKCLTNIKILDCSDNHITSLNKLKKLTNLIDLDCSNNRLTSLYGLENLNQLTTILCYDNYISSLLPLENNMILLTRLLCQNNEITSLDGIEYLTNLTELNCCHNWIKSLNGIENLRNLIEILYRNNPIDHIPPNITRILYRIQTGQDVYQDNQNVHNHSIQDSIRTSVKKILEIKPVITDSTNYILQDTILSKKTKEILLEYESSSDIYSVLDITFSELLMYVINRIEINEHKDEIKSILNVEMNESVCKCFTGRISRLVNCLAGFDPLVTIQIADNEQIAYVITTIERNLLNENTYSVDNHKELVKKQLDELGYSTTIIDEWIQNIE